ncbi:MAG TPA: NAD-dependent epimerase/dehydratase family protein [Candidatus Hydrogenedentes bacterium]|nr:NAD-dependent epimerase/dehydratase family protein [Candidatus Hydrogenedentota bacterium]HPC15703.1 NAD-dependent epimerase/dehydratase family protein [Candidatus Hydrogenedentota bacterium]HRT19673.1 NAD-dependent epimerase/dehydratase family protein [Candidatus Hydrogenedentota bacterium]HRT64447.1 NAD-dependent epimerase/dehydratase family protein [Candidatus Hydrogenedentota bacterium]
MRVLITGSSGQIGTNLGLRLLDEGHFVFGVDIRPNTWTDRIPTLLQDLSTAYRNFNGGIGQANYPEDLDVVVHLAAHAKVHELVQQPDRALENITMTFNVLEFCRQNGNIPFIFSSSREVYGDIHRYITEESHADFAFTESPYSASKIAGEALVYSYAQCYGLRYLVFRFSNVYGRYDNDIERMERVIPLFIRRIAEGQPVTVFGEKKTLDFTYVDDCVDGIHRGIELLMSKRDANHTINLAYGQGSTLITLANYVGEALGVKPDLRIEDSRVGEVTHYVANIGKARALLGYNPRTPLREGIEKAVAWSREWSAAHDKQA